MEDALFKLPKNHFAMSSVFTTIFTLPCRENAVEGTDEKPFVLHGITEDDFVSLLKVMYPLPLYKTIHFNNWFNLTSSHTSTYSQLTRGDWQLTQEEWISVLKLSTMWEFVDIRKLAIIELSKDDKMGLFEKVECGRNFDVKEWLLDGYVGLLKRAETITDEEAKRLGWQTAVKLLRLRERVNRRELANGEACRDCNQTGLRQSGRVLCEFCAGHGRGIAQVTLQNRPQRNFTEIVQIEFQTELQ